jgi:hypothetical protein
MSGLTRKQAKILQKQIGRIFGRDYTPARTANNSLSIGDILTSRKDSVPYVDGGQFNKDSITYKDGAGFSQNIFSSANMSFSFKGSGKADGKDLFDIEEAGISISFESEKEMFLKLQNVRQRTIDNFVTLRKEILSKFTKGDIQSKVFVVRGIVVADKYFLQFGSKKSGSVGLTLDADFKDKNAVVEADFDLKWQNDVGFFLDGKEGGVLAYRVSSVRLRRHLRPKKVQDLILSGMNEAEAINNLSFSERDELVKKDAFDLVDTTNEFAMLENEFEDYA